MSRRGASRRTVASFLAALLGAALLPFAAAALFGALRALLSAASGGAAAWLGAGFFGYAALHGFGALRLRRAYVLAHELTHALAAWSLGGKVFGMSVGRESGRVDLSHGGAFVSLAPYWFPLYAAGIILGYRSCLWAGVELPRAALLLGVGAALAFHWAHTAESLWTARQSDLDHAGPLLSVSLIGLLNGALLLLLLKCLFPAEVSLAGSVGAAAQAVRAFL